MINFIYKKNKPNKINLKVNKSIKAFKNKNKKVKFIKKN